MTGTVADSGGTPLSDILVVVRSFADQQTQATTRTSASGQYSVSVPAGDYIVAVVNDGTASTAASQWWTSTGGVSSSPRAGKVAVGGSAATVNLVLPPGNRISGTVNDPTTGPVANMAVGIYSNGELVQSLHTGSDGGYRVSLPPGTYEVRARGQTAAAVDVTTTDQVHNFTAAVSTVTATILDPAGDPVSGVEAFLADNAGTVLSREWSDADGNVTLYAITPANDNRVYVLAQNGRFIGSTVYQGGTELLAGRPVTTLSAAQVNMLGNITLPVANVLQGAVFRGGLPAAGINVQIRSSGVTSASRFVTVKTGSDGKYSVGVPRSLVMAARLCAFTNTSSCPDTGSGTGRSPGNYVFTDSVHIDHVDAAHFHAVDLDMH